MFLRPAVKSIALLAIGAFASASVALAAGGVGVVADSSAAEGKHFHPKGKMP